MSKRIKTNYPGVFYREAKRVGSTGTERVYYYVFKKDGQVIEEKAGRQHKDDMTPAKASKIRGERIEGKRPSPKEIKAAKYAKKQAEQNKWTIDRLWTEYKNQKLHLRGLVQDENRYNLYIKGAFGEKEPRELIQLDIDRVRIKLLKTKTSQTVKHIFSLLRRIINFGVKKTWLMGPLV